MTLGIFVIGEMNMFDKQTEKHIDLLMKRRGAVAAQKFTCPCCGTNQIQLVNWQHQVVDLRCRRCKRKFIWESPV